MEGAILEMDPKPLLLLAGAAFSMDRMAVAQTQCGGRGGPSCYVVPTSIVSSGPSSQSGWQYGFSYSAVSQTCKNTLNQMTYSINTSAGVGMSCPLKFVYSSANALGGNPAQAYASTWTASNFRGYSVFNYKDCSGFSWTRTDGAFGCGS